MQGKEPKNDHKYYWTMHSKFKILQYGLSANKIKRIIRYPDRKEEGIAPETIAVMKRKNKKDPKKGEIWVMYQKKIKSQISNLKIEENIKSKTKDKKLPVANYPVVSDLAKPDKLQTGVGQIKIISAWVYPGQSPKGKEIFVPDEVWEELVRSNDLTETVEDL